MAQSPFEIPNQLREMAQRSVEQAQVAMGQFLDAAQKMVSSGGVMRPASVNEFGIKAIAFAQVNAKAALDHAQKLVLAKDMQEVLALQSEFLRAQISALQEQAKEVSAALQKIVTSSAKLVPEPHTAPEDIQ